MTGPKPTAARTSTTPMSDASPILPGRIQRIYRPTKSAIGIVIPTVNTPHGLLKSALATAIAMPAIEMMRIQMIATDATKPVFLPISALAISASDKPL